MSTGSSLPNPPGSGPGESDIVDVIGDPISRNQAKNFGVGALDSGAAADVAVEPVARKAALSTDGPPPRAVGKAVIIGICILALLTVALLCSFLTYPGWWTRLTGKTPALAQPVKTVPSALAEIRALGPPVQEEIPAPSASLPAPVVRRIGSWADALNGPAFLAANERGKSAVIALASGRYRNGNLALMDVDSGDILASTGLAGKVTGMGWLRVEEREWLCIADFRHARLRFFDWGGSTLNEQPLFVPLPGRPVGATFVGNEGLCFVLCRTPDRLAGVLLRISHPGEYETLGEWDVPDALVLATILLDRRGEGEYPIPLLLGDDGGGVIFLPDRAMPIEPLANAGVLLAAALSGNRSAVCGFLRDGAPSIRVLDFENAPLWSAGSPGSFDPVPGGLAGGKAGIFALENTAAWLADPLRGDEPAPASVPLPSPPTTPAAITVLSTPAGEEAVFLDPAGTVWSVGRSGRPAWNGEKQPRLFNPAATTSASYRRAMGRNGRTQRVALISAAEPALAIALLWQAASEPDQQAVFPVYMAGLESAYPAVRQNAIDILSASEVEDVARIFQIQLAREEDEQTIRLLAACLADLPEEEAVDSLLAVMADATIGLPVVRAVSDELRLLTGVCLPDNADAWLAWKRKDDTASE